MNNNNSKSHFYIAHITVRSLCAVKGNKEHGIQMICWKITLSNVPHGRMTG